MDDKNETKYVYKLDSTSANTGAVESIVLRPTKPVSESLTRRVVKIQLVDNIHDANKAVGATIQYQKRHSKAAPWQDADSFNLRQLKQGEEVRIELDSSQTYDLFVALQNMYAVTKDGVPHGDKQITVHIEDGPFIKVLKRFATKPGSGAEVDADDGMVVKGKPIKVIRFLLDNYGDETWEAVETFKSELPEVIANHKIQQYRRERIEEFQLHLTQSDWPEPKWQDFFKANTWIFGYGLDYRFLAHIQDQPFYGGKAVNNKGGQRGDTLMASVADHRFTVLVEIKEPASRLLGKELEAGEEETYRNKVYELGKELTGGVSQLQSNCRTWIREGAEQEETRERFRDQNIFTVEPKAILIIGHTQQLDNIDKRNTFELFRRNLHNPDIITYDELLARAEFLVSNADTMEVIK